MSVLAQLSPVVTNYLNGILFLNSETSPEMLEAELYLFFGGLLFAFIFGAWSMVLRATRATGRDIDL